MVVMESITNSVLDKAVELTSDQQRNV